MKMSKLNNLINRLPEKAVYNEREIIFHITKYPGGYACWATDFITGDQVFQAISSNELHFQGKTIEEAIQGMLNFLEEELIIKEELL
jgi:hypothetical protein